MITSNSEVDHKGPQKPHMDYVMGQKIKYSVKMIMFDSGYGRMKNRVEKA